MTPFSSFSLYLVLVLAVVVVSDPRPYPQVVSISIFLRSDKEDITGERMIEIREKWSRG